MYTIIFSQQTFIHKDALQFPIEERGLQFGDGVYEVVRVYNGKPYLLDEHIKRLYRSLEAIYLTIYITKKQLTQYIQQLIKKNKMQEDGFIYLQVTRGVAERNHSFPHKVEPNIFAYIKKRKRPVELLINGVKAITHRDERWDNCYIKSLNLLPNVLARQKAKTEGAYEAILHREETVTEGSASNIFLVKNGDVYTHPETKQILNGCVRTAVIKFASERGIRVYEQAFTLDDLTTADEVFLTSSISEIIPIIQINNQTITNGKRGELTTVLQRSYANDAQIKSVT